MMWQPQGFYNQYFLRTPVILSGENAIRGLYNYPSAKIAVIHGKSFTDKETFNAVFLKRDIRFMLRSWEGEPDIAGLKGTIHELEEYQPDTIIAVGGGSVIDGGKLCRLFYECPYYEPEATRLDGDTLRTKFIAVPSTVGSGAEVSSAAVYVDGRTGSKNMIVLHSLMPDAVVYDNRCVKDAPLRLVCASSLDATAHILEGYVSGIDNVLADVLAEKGMSIIAEELSRITEGKADYTRLQYAGFIGGLVQNHCLAGAAHAIAHQLANYGYSHGEAVALLLPSVIRMNAGTAGEKYNRIALMSGFDSIEGLAEFILHVCRFSGIDEKRKELKSLLERLSDSKAFCESVRADKSGRENPAEITDSYIRECIRSI